MTVQLPEMVRTFWNLYIRQKLYGYSYHVNSRSIRMPWLSCSFQRVTPRYPIVTKELITAIHRCYTTLRVISPIKARLPPSGYVTAVLSSYHRLEFSAPDNGKVIDTNPEFLVDSL
jgi:hypothetical protein